MQAPGRSQPVAAIDLACAHRTGDYWEPLYGFMGADELGAEPGSSHERSPGGQRFDDEPLPSQSGGSPDLPGVESSPANYNDTDHVGGARIAGARTDDTPQVRKHAIARAETGLRRQEQSVSYQPEERYWTDYLRIALPIAGLLLLLGVFWYWASSFIGDDDNDPGQSTVVAVVDTPITAETQTPTVSAAVTLGPAPTAPPTQPTQPEVEETTETAPPTATTAPAENGGEEEGEFAEGDLVVVNDNDVNLRADASTTSDVIVVLTNGQELTVASGSPVDDGTYVWWNVETVDGEVGWVAGDFLQKSGT